MKFGNLLKWKPRIVGKSGILLQSEHFHWLILSCVKAVLLQSDPSLDILAWTACVKWQNRTTDVNCSRLPQFHPKWAHDGRLIVLHPWIQLQWWFQNLINSIQWEQRLPVTSQFASSMLGANLLHTSSPSEKLTRIWRKEKKNLHLLLGKMEITDLRENKNSVRHLGIRDFY